MTLNAPSQTMFIVAVVIAVIALLGALGVWAVPNAPKPQRGEVVASAPDA